MCLFFVDTQPNVSPVEMTLLERRSVMLFFVVVSDMLFFFLTPRVSTRICVEVDNGLNDTGKQVLDK